MVARIESLAVKINEARTVRRKQEQEVRQMLVGSFQKVTRAAPPRVLMRYVAPLVRRPVDVDPEALYPELGIRSFGNGAFHKPALSGLKIGGKRIFKIEPDDLSLTTSLLGGSNRCCEIRRRWVLWLSSVYHVRSELGHGDVPFPLLLFSH